MSSPHNPLGVANNTPNSRANSPRIGLNDPPPHQDAQDPPPNVRNAPLVNLAEDQYTASVIGSITSHIREVDLLAPDGSNYAVWSDFIQERLRDAINNHKYLLHASTSTVHKRIARSILLSSINCSMRRNIGRHASAQLMYLDLRARFNTVSRAAQIAAFRRLLRFNIRDHPTTATITTSINDALDELERLNITLTRDQIAGLVLQNGLGSDPELMREVDRRVEQAMQASRTHEIPEFKSMVRIIDIVRQNMRHARETGKEDHQMPPQQPLAMQATAAIPIPTPAAPTPHPDNVPDAGNFLAMQAGVCWQCCSPDHLLRNCPMRQRFNPGRQPTPNYQQQRRYQPTHPAPHGGFTPFYPIVAPAGSVSTYPTVQQPARYPGPQAPINPTPGRPADSYRPQYRLQRVGNPCTGTKSLGDPSPPAARMAEAPALTEDTQAQIVELGDLSNDLANLNFWQADVEMAEGAPIVDSVATEGNPAYITGQGDLQFNGLDNQRVTIHGVLYCKLARTTLISLAAFRKANAYFTYNNKWVFPVPMTNPSFIPFPTSVSPSTALASGLPSPSFCPITTDDRLNIKNNFYVPLDMPTETVRASERDLTTNERTLMYWHRLFGHASLRKIRNMCKMGFCLNLPSTLPPGDIKCSTCAIRCAISKSLLKNRLSTTDRPSPRLSIITTDIIGPFQVPTFNGGLYVLTLRDLGTGYSEAKIMKNKDQACKMVITTIQQWECITGNRVRTVRSDNGGEYNSKVFLSYLASRGITAERALPYHHYQNGAIERYNRTLTSSGPATPSTEYQTEKRQKLDARAFEGRVVANCSNGKGWIFWLKDTNKLVASAIVDWQTKRPATEKVISVSRNITEKPVQSLLPTVPIVDKPANKHRLDFIINKLTLGDHSDDVLIRDQEILVDKMLQECSIFALTVPRTYQQVQKSPAWNKWKDTIEEELGSLFRMKVWSALPCPTDRKPLDGRWVFAEKSNNQSEVVRWKARYVAKGFTQVKGYDFNKTFAPTATFASMRLLLSLAGYFNWPVRSFDFVAAYLNSPIDEEVWVKAPEGMKLPLGYAMKLHKALYGTKQAARCWWLHLKGILESLGYKASQYDHSLYTLQHPKEIGIIWIHVDDGIVTGSSDELLKKLEASLKGILQIKWSNGLDSIVDHWDGIMLTKTPLPPALELITDPDGIETDSTAFLSVVGSLSYLAVGTRPDIAYAVNVLA
ncbi:hypothetical protein MJO28_006992 [Puccinia striiformis f. sp. tritici]|uniref:Uncharacterized protein n=1 Tax=Puccinia striiformis f. sp. tritici TaxID=168172 RepID=A0ACC0EEU5_9BASI|nr:hypothetical protein MJO28_006992 [Puccinia striiformis f. sp. tritici]